MAMAFDTLSFDGWFFSWRGGESGDRGWPAQSLGQLAPGWFTHQTGRYRKAVE